MKRLWLPMSVFCVFTIAGYALMHGRIDRIRPARERMEERLIYIPNPQFIRTASLGFHAVVADLLWARAVVYFGGHFLTDRDYRWLYHLLDAVTTLDPENMIAYRFGGTLLALEEKDVDASIKLLKKGIRDNPDEDWRLYFLLGFNYFFYMEDYASATKYLEKASDMPGHPEYLPRLVARMYAKAGDIDTAIEFLKGTYQQYEDENVKAVIEERINILFAKKQIPQFQHAADSYKDAYGEYPKDLKELADAGLIEKLPVFPDGHFVIDPDGRVDWVSETSPHWP